MAPMGNNTLIPPVFFPANLRGNYEPEKSETICCIKILYNISDKPQSSGFISAEGSGAVSSDLFRLISDSERMVIKTFKTLVPLSTVTDRSHHWAMLDSEAEKMRPAAGHVAPASMSVATEGDGSRVQ